MYIRLQAVRFDNIKARRKRRTWWAFWQWFQPETFSILERGASVDGARFYSPIYETEIEASEAGEFDVLEITDMTPSSSRVYH